LGCRGLFVQLQRVLSSSSSSVALALASCGYLQNLSSTFRLSIMETFEIIREDDGTSLGEYMARPQGKLVSEVLLNLEYEGLEGILLMLLEDKTITLTDSDLLIVGRVYKFRPSVHVSSAGL
jgi:hypothetical protein